MNTKEAILTEVPHLFVQQGCEAVSMRDIAGRLDITLGALYRHYASKRDIFHSILRRTGDTTSLEQALPDHVERFTRYMEGRT